MSLDALPLPILPNSAKVADIIPSLVGTLEYQEVLKLVNNWPSRSQTHAPFRALMYLATRLLRPQLVVEIGTMFAGTSELFATALMHNGCGLLRTIDPYGIDRAPPILDRWPAQLRRYLDFRPINSMEMFAEMGMKNERADMVFVDGNHQYEYALFDLLSSARNIRPKGIIMMDNYDLPGVIGACKDFERSNPAWEPLRFSAHPSFGSREERLRLDGLYRIYVAPCTIPIGAQPVEFFSGNLAADGVRGFHVELAEPSAGGVLYYQIYLRLYPWNLGEGVGEIEELGASGSITLQQRTTNADIRLNIPLVTTLPMRTHHRRIDIALLFEGGPNARPLLLKGEPVHDLVKL